MFPSLADLFLNLVNLSTCFPESLNRSASWLCLDPSSWDLPALTPWTSNSWRILYFINDDSILLVAQVKTLTVILWFNSLCSPYLGPILGGLHVQTPSTATTTIFSLTFSPLLLLPCPWHSGSIVMSPVWFKLFSSSLCISSPSLIS